MTSTQKKANFRLGLILLTIAVVLFVGFMVRAVYLTT
ncbi:MAG: cytochrome oxidase small assembly protein [Burkholderiales bacterium]